MSIDLFWLLGRNALLIPSPVIAAIFCASDDPSILSQYAKLETLHNPRHDDKGGLARRWRQPADGQESHEVEKNHSMQAVIKLTQFIQMVSNKAQTLQVHRQCHVVQALIEGLTKG